MKKRKFLTFAVLLFTVLMLASAKGEAGWKNYSGGKRKYYVTSTKSYVKNSWYKIKGKWFYFDKKGWVKTGRFKVGKDWYYCKKATGRVTKKKVGSYYYGEDGKMVTNCWKKCGKYTFYFGKNGKLKTGKFTVEGKTYYCSKKTGRAVKKRIGDYYYGKDGAMVKNCWAGKYYYGSNGKAKYGQFTVNGKTYYCDKSKGKLTSQWKDKHYYDEDGVMATNQWVNESYVDGKGNITKGDKNPKNPPTAAEIRLLAALTYLEAGNQSYYGKQCVASVVVNRVNSKKFPNTLKGVIYQSGQFTPAMNGSLTRLVKSSKKIQAQCVKAATHVLTRGSVLKGYYYFNTWGGRKRVGDHYFS